MQQKGGDDGWRMGLNSKILNFESKAVLNQPLVRNLRKWECIKNIIHIITKRGTVQVSVVFVTFVFLIIMNFRAFWTSVSLSLIAMISSSCEALFLDLSRRSVLRKSIEASALLIFSPMEPASAATKAKGAAELDFEYYMRDLIGGNKREGTVLPSASPPVSKPRTLRGPVIPLLLDKEFSSSCIATQALIQQLQKGRGKIDELGVAKEIQDKAVSLREKISKSFYSRSPWDEESINDQYYFDVTAYAFFKTAAEMIPDYVERDQFVRRLGKLIYKRLQDEKLVTKTPIETPVSLVATLSATIELLDLFQNSNFCVGYKIRRDDSDNGSGNNKDEPIFDELDDDSLISGLNVDCLVSIYGPASLGASLQINGEGSRFGPDFVGTTLAAIWDTAGIKSSWETFFVDPEYR